MEFEVGSVLAGKVTGIAKFGAFVALPGGKSGLVHISEIANTFVGDVHDFLQEGQEVSVKVLSIDAGGKINLSIKQAARTGTAPQAQRAPREPRSAPRNFSRPAGSAPAPASRPAPQEAQPKPPQETSFEDKLKKFMQDSDSKMSDIKMYSDKRTSRRRNRG